MHEMKFYLCELESYGTKNWDFMNRKKKFIEYSVAIDY